MAIIHSLKCTVPFSFVVPLLSLSLTHCHLLSLVVSLAVTRCSTHCHSMSLVVSLAVTRCTTRCHSLSLDVPLVCLFINDHKKLMTASINNETGLFYNRTSPLYNLRQQGYANFLHNQRLSKTTSPCILIGRVNQTDVSNTNKIFTSTSKKTNLNKILTKPLKTSLFK